MDAAVAVTCSLNLLSADLRHLRASKAEEYLIFILNLEFGSQYLCLCFDACLTLRRLQILAGLSDSGWQSPPVKNRLMINVYPQVDIFLNPKQSQKSHSDNLPDSIEAQLAATGKASSTTTYTVNAPPPPSHPPPDGAREFPPPPSPEPTPMEVDQEAQPASRGQ